jgi:hypothetical protein
VVLKGHGFKACPEPVEGCRKDRKIGGALQAAEKLRFLPKNSCFVTGHGFKACPEPVEGCRKDRKIGGALQAAEKLRFLPKNSCFVTGHDFSRAVSRFKSTWASAPASCFSTILPVLHPFPQPV